MTYAVHDARRHTFKTRTRHEAILNALQAHKEPVFTHTLACELDREITTLHLDLNTLAAMGLVSRITPAPRRGPRKQWRSQFMWEVRNDG